MAVSSAGRLSELASVISDAARLLEEELKNSGLPEPSFDLDALPTLPPHLQSQQHAALSALEELQVLIAGPLPSLVRTISPIHNIQFAVQIIHRYAIPTKVPISGEPIPFQELASLCKLSPSDMTRILRVSTAHRIFEERPLGSLRHKALSRHLVDMPGLNQWFGFFTDEVVPAAAHAADALQRWPGSQEPVHTGWNAATGKDCSIFDDLGDSPARMRRFTEGFSFLRSAPEFHKRHLLGNLGWTETDCPETVLDIGGSNGGVAIELLRKFSIKACIVQDLPSVISTAKVPSDLRDRLVFEPRSLFSAQGFQGADVYLFRNVLHDWSDKYASLALKALVPALRPSSKIILNEVCLPEPGQLSKYEEQLLRGYDVTMMQLLNSKERNETDWKTLLR